MCVSLCVIWYSDTIQSSAYMYIQLCLSNTYLTEFKKLFHNLSRFIIFFTLSTRSLSHRSSETDSHGQEYVILGADIRTFEDPKRSFTFSVTCTGVPEMYFSAEDEDTLLEWLSKLAAASVDTEKCELG